MVLDSCGGWRSRTIDRSNGKNRGANVIGTVSTKEKAAVAFEAGCDRVILYSKEDFVAEVKKITENKGLPVVYDSVGKDTYEGSMNCLMPRWVFGFVG